MFNPLTAFLSFLGHNEPENNDHSCKGHYRKKCMCEQLPTSLTLRGLMSHICDISPLRGLECVPSVSGTSP